MNNNTTNKNTHQITKDKEKEYYSNLIEEGGEFEAEDADLSKEIAKIEESLLNKKEI